MKGEQQEIKKATGQLGSAIKKDEGDHVQQVIQRTTRKGASPKDVLGLTDAMVEGIYGQAYRLYNTGKYKDASQLFRLLLMINSSEPKYVMGLAACFHLLKEYQSAVDTYALLGVIDAQNPIPFYHCSDCFIQMNDRISAIISLEMAIKRAGDKPEFVTLKDRAKLTLESLKKELEKNNKEK